MKTVRTIEIEETRYLLKVEKPFFLAGEAMKPGRIVEVSAFEASNLVARGLASEPTQEEVDSESDLAVSPPEKISRGRA